MLLGVISIIITFLVLFYICNNGKTFGESVTLTGKTQHLKEISEEWSPIVYWDYNRKCHVHRKTGILVNEYFSRDDEGNPFNYYCTKPDLFGHQKFIDACYVYKNKHNDPVKLPEHILNNKYLDWNLWRR